MNKRKLRSFALCAMLPALCIPAEAQQQAKIAKIGWLGARSAPRQGEYSTGALVEVQRTLRELGYVEGKNIEFESRYADNVLAKLPDLADKMLATGGYFERFRSCGIEKRKRDTPSDIRYV